MKERLFSHLDNAGITVSNALAAINSVHASRQNYNYTVKVPYEHKCKVVKWAKWVHKTETRYRDEVRFDQGRFDGDLNNANQRLQQAQSGLHLAEQVIRQEINSAQSQIACVNSFENGVNNLRSNNTHMQSQLPYRYVYNWNLSDQISQIKHDLNHINNQKNQHVQDIRELPDKIQQINNDSAIKKSQIEIINQQRLQVTEAEMQSHMQLHQKLTGLNEVDRAALAYEMIAAGNNTILCVLENCGFFIEKTAQIATCKNHQQVFNYCINKGLKFDCLVFEKETLALSIINSGNGFFINKLFASNQELKLTTFMAATCNNFNALQTLLQHDRDALHKFKDVEGCGFGILQHAIASNNVALIDFVSKHDSSCFKEKLVGYGSYFQMALTYNQSEVIKIIGKNASIYGEILDLVKANETDMFDRAIANIDLVQEEVLAVLKCCIEHGCLGMAETIVEKIINIKQAFLGAVAANNIELAHVLISLKPGELSFEYVSSLVNNDNNENTALLLSQILDSNTDNETGGLLLTGENNYEIQIDHT